MQRFNNKLGQKLGGPLKYFRLGVRLKFEWRRPPTDPFIRRFFSSRFMASSPLSLSSGGDTLDGHDRFPRAATMTPFCLAASETSLDLYIIAKSHPRSQTLFLAHYQKLTDSSNTADVDDSSHAVYACVRHISARHCMPRGGFFKPVGRSMLI